MTYAIYGNTDRRSMYDSESEALTRAKRIAEKQPGRTFYVMAQVAAVTFDSKKLQMIVDDAGRCDDCGARIV